MSERVVLASSNPGKVRELAAMLAEFDRELVTQSSLGIGEVAETGTTFVENAIIKARHAAGASGLAAIADDSGIEVDALDGAPGVHSARFAGEQADDDANNRKLIESLRDVAPEQRTASYRCVIVYLRYAADPSPLIAEGQWRGLIQLTARGDNGFGYDPYFYLPELACTSAELAPEQKNRLSHRGQALRELVAKLSG